MWGAGRIAENVVLLTRVLRQAGLAVGGERPPLALQALEIVGLERRDQVHAALSAVLVDRHENQPIFDAAFTAFFAALGAAVPPDPSGSERSLDESRSGPQRPVRPRENPRHRRLDDALARLAAAAPREPSAAPDEAARPQAASIETFSARETLRAMDFESMSVEEFDQARRLAAQLPWILEPVKVRRTHLATRGTPDLRATLRQSARQALAPTLALRRRREQPPPLVILCDISGSMKRYSRMFLHWAHALGRDFARVETLTLGTRLTRITRLLTTRDVDEAIAHAGRQVADWGGGTRLGPCLREFNRRWARRLLTGNATVLWLTDGLDRDDPERLAREAAKLRGFAHRVIWLNPLLRFEGFEPRAAGVRAMLPHVDAFIPAHNLNSLADLTRTLADARRADPKRFQRRHPPAPGRAAVHTR